MIYDYPRSLREESATRPKYLKDLIICKENFNIRQTFKCRNEYRKLEKKL